MVPSKDVAPSPVRSTDDQPRTDVPLSLFLILAVAIGVRLFLLVQARATEEDFFITLRYAQHLAQGAGFVYNVGERVLGTTTPLYTLLLALFIRLDLNPILCGKLFGIAADALACAAVYRLGRAVDRPGCGILAAVCLALLPINLTWATKGMEVGIVASTAVWAWTFWAERRENSSWAAAALLVLLRIDGMALVLVLLIATLVRDRRLPSGGIALFALMLAPWLFFATLYFGSPIPASLQAKLIVYGYHLHQPFPRLREFVFLMTHNGYFLLMLGFLLALVFLSMNAAKRICVPKEALLLPAGIWILLYYGSMALSNVFLFGWYFVPPTPLYYLIAITGWDLTMEWLAARFPARLSRFHPLQPSLPAVSVLSILLCVLFVPKVLADLRRTQEIEDGMRIPIGLWLHVHARPTDTVMLEPIGYIGYYSGLRVLDTVALVSPEVLPLWKSSYLSPRHEMWLRFSPRWVLLRAGEWFGLQKEESTLPVSQRLPAHYRLAGAWKDPANPAVGIDFYLFERIENEQNGRR